MVTICIVGGRPWRPWIKTIVASLLSKVPSLQYQILSYEPPKLIDQICIYIYTYIQYVLVCLSNINEDGTMDSLHPLICMESNLSEIRCITLNPPITIMVLPIKWPIHTRLPVKKMLRISHKIFSDITIYCFPSVAG